MCFLVVIGMTACSASGSGAAGNDELTIGISLPTANHGWMAALIDNGEKKAKEIKEEKGINYIMTNAGDPNAQANDVEDLISQGVDVIVMEPIESAALSPVGERIKNAGIPLVIVDRELENNSATVVVKGDNEGIGINAGEYFLDQIDGKAKIVEITGSPTSVTKQRGAGFKEAIDSAENIEIIASQSGDFTQEKALEVMQNILQAHSEIDAVFTQDDGMAVGVMQAIRESGRDDIQFVTGAGGNKQVFENIKEGGLMKATFLYPPTMIEDALDIAADIAQGKEPEETYIVTEAVQVTKENVDEYYDPDSKY